MTQDNNNNNKDWWWPVITDAKWAQKVRAEGYWDIDHKMSDDALRDEYGDGRKYADEWHDGEEAMKQWDVLADDWVRLKKLAGEKYE